MITTAVVVIIGFGLGHLNQASREENVSRAMEEAMKKTLSKAIAIAVFAFCLYIESHFKS